MIHMHCFCKENLELRIVTCCKCGIWVMIDDPLQLRWSGYI